jgi:uncharacterized protein
MSPTETVYSIYAAFGRGDVAAIIDCLDPEVDWEYGQISTDVPWLQHCRGHAEVLEFFQRLQAFQISTFVPKAVLAQGDLVIGLIDVGGTVPASGGVIDEEDEIHIWRFNAAGKVARFRHRCDTYQQWRAFHGGA